MIEYLICLIIFVYYCYCRYDIAKCETKILDTLRTLNNSIKDSNVSGGLINHFPFLRYIIPSLSGYNAITERYKQMWSFFEVRK